MAGYRDTLNLPRTDFPMKADLVKREPERLSWWETHGFYGRLRDARRGRQVHLLHDGPPYSNDHIHMGTASNKIWKDAVVRAASLMGYDSPYVPGWDNHGMPIEVRVAREFREKKVEPDRVTLRKRCREFAQHWVGVHRQEFQRLGIWGEWEHPYLTMDPHFEAAILETFGALVRKGFVQRGLRSIHWCPTDRTALAEAEIEYQDDPSPSILVAFPLREDPRGLLGSSSSVSAVAWTTTPWTLPANRALMVDPDAEYVVAEISNRRLLVAKARLESVAETLGATGPTIERGVRGRDLIGLIFEAPWGNASRIIDGTPYVSLEEGTGLVHTAPGHGKEDFVVGQRAGLEVASPVDEAGRFTAGAEPFVGRSVLEANDDIIAWLRERGRLLSATTFRHAYPHCWRCHQPVIFRATKQWFMIIDHDGHRDRALEIIDEHVRWEPASSRNRIRDAVRLRPDWCLSRQRSWGVGIPALYCEGCEEGWLDAGVVDRAAALTREHGSDVWFERPVTDFVTPGLRCPRCGGSGPFRKETDILDVWFDSGSTHRAIQTTHPELAPPWKQALAGGRVIYFEGPDQHRGWFNSSLMVGVGIERRAPFTDVLTHGWVLDAEGRAMHKSLGNVVSPLKVIDRLGADIVRWWALSTDWRSDVRVGDEILQRVADAYRKIRNTFRFLLGNLHDFDPSLAVPVAEIQRVDQAFAAHLAFRVARMRQDYERHAFHRVADSLLELCTVDLSSVFLDVTKDRLYTLSASDMARRSAQTVLWSALHDLTIAASPLLVFTAEEVWQSHPSLREEQDSVHLAEWPAVRQVEGTEEAWAALNALRAAVNSALEPMRAAKTLATTQEADVRITAPPGTIARLEPYRDELAGFLMVARGTLVADSGVSEMQIRAERTSWTRCERCWTHREDVEQRAGGDPLCSRCLTVLQTLPSTAR